MSLPLSIDTENADVELDSNDLPLTYMDVMENVGCSRCSSVSITTLDIWPESEEFFRNFHVRTEYNFTGTEVGVNEKTTLTNA